MRGGNEFRIVESLVRHQLTL